MKPCGLNTQENGSLNNDNVRSENKEERKQRLVGGGVRQCVCGVSLELLNLFTNSIGEGNRCHFSGSQNQRRRSQLPEEPVSYIILI